MNKYKIVPVFGGETKTIEAANAAEAIRQVLPSWCGLANRFPVHPKNLLPEEREGKAEMVMPVDARWEEYGRDPFTVHFVGGKPSEADIASLGEEENAFYAPMQPLVAVAERLSRAGLLKGQ